MINRHFEGTNELFDDGSHIIYVNDAYKGDDAIGNLMANMKLGAEQAMNLLGVSESDRTILMKEL